jgi:anti-sigma regulatory factor (Ser/Thr protein kinase)
MGALGEVLELDSQVLSDIKLAITEACTNVVVHAYAEAEGPMSITAEVDAGRLVVAVCDEGRGIAPRADSPGLGLGLPLIATLAEAVELGRDAEEHTEVRMVFRLDPEPSAPEPEKAG